LQFQQWSDLSEAGEPPRGAIQVMQIAFEAAGGEFTNGDEPGVKLGAKKG
jgi:hypothetical protein